MNCLLKLKQLERIKSKLDMIEFDSILSTTFFNSLKLLDIEIMS